MMRFVAGIAGWVAATAIAVSVAWFGANVVLADAGADPGVPVINAALPAATLAPTPLPPSPPLPPSSSSSSPSSSSSSSSSAPRSPTASQSRTRTSTATQSSTATPSPSASSHHTTGTASPSSTPSTSSTAGTTATTGTAHAYTLTGGRVTLDMTATSVQLVSAVPNAGYSVQQWSGTDWLRVDFSSGSQVSSLIASWYQHAPTVTVEN